MSTDAASLACLLRPPGLAHPVALPPHVCVGWVAAPPLVPVPWSTAACAGVFLWEGRLVVAVDPRPDPRAARGAPHGWVIVEGGRPGQGRLPCCALAVEERPFILEVRDRDACALPDPLAHWARLAVSAFRYDGEAVPILAAERLLAG